MHWKGHRFTWLVTSRVLFMLVYPLTGRFYGDGRKPENTEETHADKGKHLKLHTDSNPSSG